MLLSFFRKFLLLTLFSSPLIAEQSHYLIEGLYRDPIEKKIYLIDRFLTYNPMIVALGCSPEDEMICKLHWPYGTFYCADPLNANSGLRCDLIWVDSEGAELYFLERATDLLKQAKVVYTSTHFYHQSVYYLKLKQHLESFGFSLLTHWYRQGQNGNAIFVRREVLEASLRSLSYSPPQPNIPAVLSPPLEFERFLRPAENKSPLHTLDGIDFIYMINLDERPEKFALAANGLQQFGINPYRFSAVNGWKLPADAFSQLGVSFLSGMLQEKFLGTIYEVVGNRAYMSNEFIQENGNTYFTLGMSPGAIGIVLSHLSILQDAYDSGYQTIWIMEDDVEAVDDPRQIPGLIRKLDEQVGDWDILFTDMDTKDSNGNHVPCRAIAARPNKSIEPLSVFYQRFYSVSNEFSRTGMRYGAYSMIVRRSGMKKILDYFRNYRIYLPYDLDFWLVPDIKMYCVKKDIVSHRAGAPSDNSAPFYLKNGSQK